MKRWLAFYSTIALALLFILGMLMVLGKILEYFGWA